VRVVWTAIPVSPFVARGHRQFGTWLPISARVKSSFPLVDLAQSLDTIRHTSLNARDRASFAAADLAAWMPRMRLQVTSALYGRTDAIEVDAHDIVLNGRLARGFGRGRAGSAVTLARYSP